MTIIYCQLFIDQISSLKVAILLIIVDFDKRKKIMRRNKDRKVRKSIFDEVEDQVQDPVPTSKTIVQEPKSKTKKILARQNQAYQAKQIKENEIYYEAQQKDSKADPETKILSEKVLTRANRRRARKNIFQFEEENEEDKENAFIGQPVHSEERDAFQQKNCVEQINLKEIITFQSTQQEQKKHSMFKIQLSDSEDEGASTDQKGANFVVTFQEDSTSNKTVYEQGQPPSAKFLEMPLKYDIPGTKRLIYEPLPQDRVIVCKVKRSRNAFTEAYQLLLEDNQQPFLYCQKQKGSIGANYYISLTEQMNKNAETYLGKVRGNALGSSYSIFDSGKVPQNGINRKDWRAVMGKIQYESNFMGMNGPRRLQVFLPNIKNVEELDSFKVSEKEEEGLYKSSAIRKLKSKQPKWIQCYKSFGLNFGGGVKCPSIKNFILIDSQADQQNQVNAQNLLTFGKIDQQTFNLEITYPFSLFQAFSVVITQFDFKIHCQ